MEAVKKQHKCPRCKRNINKPKGEELPTAFVDGQEICHFCYEHHIRKAFTNDGVGTF